ncbi:class A beta-lactamase [Paracoccus sp. NGMCC 1.201697]|uniref:Beta-lactamase n=1 Tax=Paracoccus broussonetiae subsp. drimophilus TaxID=3373869 RepID=A0ABW7LHG1_9RHOB
MSVLVRNLRRVAAIAALTLAPSVALAASPFETTVAGIEQRLGGRVGIAVHDSGARQGWGYRQDERFLMNSTFKAVLCGAVLAQRDKGALSLSEVLPIAKSDIQDHAPIASTRIGGGMSLAELCFATLDQSDNTAANLLIQRLGGPAGVTAFLHGIGDQVSRLDRMEPELNTLTPGDLRDTTSPAAMIATWQKMLQGDALTPDSRRQLADWMRPGGVTGALLRPSVPKGWDVADKSGSGRNTRNIVAMLTPPGRAPIFVAIYISDTDADFATRNATLAEVGRAVMGRLTED